MAKIYIIGVGPGSIDYLIPAARSRIEEADCLIGAKRVLSQFRYPDKKKLRLEGNFKEVGAYIKKNKAREKIVILVSGDPGLYSFLRQAQLILKKREYAVIPGISTLQLAFARIGESWQDAKVISIHGRPLSNLAEEAEASGKVFLLTDRKFPPQRVAEYLLKLGLENRRAIVLENLTYPHERIVRTNLKELSGMKGFGLCVMIIEK